MAGKIDLTSGFKYTSDEADGASAVAFDFDTDNTYSTAGAKLASWGNNGIERVSIGYEGVLSINTPVMGANADVINVQVNSVEMFTVDEDGDGFLNSLTCGNAKFGGLTSLLTCFHTTGARARRDLPSPFEFNWAARNTDSATQDTNITGGPAQTSASTNINGGAVNITGGAGASGSAGDADGGDVVISGGQEYGTGSVGNIIMPTLPTSDPSVSGALWNDSGTLKISA